MYGIGNIGRSASRFFSSMRDLSVHTRHQLVIEISEVRGLMPLLMKPRNRQRWTREDKALLVIHLKRLSTLSPYVVVLVMPGGFLALPVLAWWLDRRRPRERAPTTGT